MARAPRKTTATIDVERLRHFIRAHAGAFLAQPNVTSVGIGHKIRDGRSTGELALQFTVARKLQPEALVAERLQPIPPSLTIDGVEVPTDIIERDYQPSWTLVEPGQMAKELRKQRLDPVRPGCSLAHHRETAGTLGAIVYDLQDGAACGLSNWHVLQGPSGSIGDAVVQPGPFDDNRIEHNALGTLFRSHLGPAGDCAVVRLEGRAHDPSILGLDRIPARVARAEIGDRAVKSGRTTGVTHGIVERVDVMVKLDYGGNTGSRIIGGFEIGPDSERPAMDGEISKGGDSGSAWLGTGAGGETTDVMLGLHFAGEGTDAANEHAMACYAHSVLEKLQVGLAPVAPEVLAQRMGLGYQPNFLGLDLPWPEAGPALLPDVLQTAGGAVVHHTHFSLSMHRVRRLALWVAWNVDGTALKAIGRKGLRFRLDPEVPAEAQLGEELYARNRLDRGHLARRADLVWGPEAEARRANADSFYFSNIAPQHESFNQSAAGGLWGGLEDAIFEGAEIDRLRLSVMAAPLYEAADPAYRGVQIPRAFWKLIAYRDAAAGGRLAAHAYILTQHDLLKQVEVLDLDPFRLYEVPLGVLQERTGLIFAGFEAAMMMTESARGRRRTIPTIREVTSRAGILG
jgi:endonuclease G